MAHPTDPAQLAISSIFKKHPTNYQANFFTESRQEFTELEKKIVVLVLNQIGHMALNRKLTPGADIKFHIPYTELTKARYDQIAAAAETLQVKRIMYRDDASEKFRYIVPFPEIRSEVVNGKKVIELTMWHTVVPRFAELGQRYTKYAIDVMLSLSSVYAQRMFEIVSMYHNRGQNQFRYLVDELRNSFNCPDTYTYNDFRKNVLQVGQRELQQKANLYVDWQPTKKDGKRIIELEFSIKTQQQIASQGVEQDRRKFNGMSINEAVITAWQLMANYSFKKWQKELIASERDLLDTFLRIDSELANGKRPAVKNPTAYMIKSLGISQDKAPQKRTEAPKVGSSTTATLTPSPMVRTGATQTIGDIFNNMNKI